MVRRTAVLLLPLLAGCGGCGGGGDSTRTSPAKSTPSRKTPARTTPAKAQRPQEEPLPRPSLSTSRPKSYRPGDPDCRARRAPGTVGSIGEDVAGGGVRVADFVACYGTPVSQRKVPGGRCLYYRDRGETTYWELCAREGRIVGGSGNQPRSALP